MRAADEITQLRAKLDTMTAERNWLRIALNDARSALKPWARWDEMTEAELALALEAAATAVLAKAGRYERPGSPAHAARRRNA